MRRNDEAFRELEVRVASLVLVRNYPVCVWNQERMFAVSDRSSS